MFTEGYKLHHKKNEKKVFIKYIYDKYKHHVSQFQFITNKINNKNNYIDPHQLHTVWSPPINYRWLCNIGS